MQTIEGPVALLLAYMEKRRRSGHARSKRQWLAVELLAVMARRDPARRWSVGLIHKALQRLVELGILERQPESGQEEPTRWRLAEAAEPPREPPVDEAGPGDGDDGDGFAEVLAHPILFSLPDKDFEELLANHLKRDHD